jgi:hypothetical protein
MIFDFGPIAQFIEVTAQFSNAVLLAVVPYVTNFAAKVELSPSAEFNTGAVRRVVINPRSDDVSGSIWFTNGCKFGFDHGQISYFQAPNAYTVEQDPERVPTYFGSVRMTPAQAIEFAREKLTRLGYSSAAVLFDFEPELTLPEKVGTNVIPVYEVKWADPRGGFTVEMEVNAKERALKKLRVSSRNIWQSSFRVGVHPPLRPDHPFTDFRPRGINPEYGMHLFPIVLSAAMNFSDRIGLALPKPLTTNHIARFWASDNGGWPVAELHLTNGACFVYRGTNMAGYFAPDQFWDDRYNPRVVLSEVTGRWRMSDSEMIALARYTLRTLGYSNDFIHVEAVPELIKPPGQFAARIPRCRVEWMYPNSQSMTQWSYVEIDADKRSVKSVYFDDKSFWGSKPQIDVMISEDAH